MTNQQMQWQYWGLFLIVSIVYNFLTAGIQTNSSVSILEGFEPNSSSPPAITYGAGVR